MTLLKKMISNTTWKACRKKWVFKQLSMFWLKAKQEKQRKTNTVRIFVKCYVLSVSFILFYDFDLKYENVMFFHNLCHVAGLR